MYNIYVFVLFTVQPADVKMFIEIDGEPNGNETLHLKPKQNVNVTCVVERLYPELKEGNRPFTITWGDKDESSYTSAPNGNAFTYTVTMNTNVTIDHKNGTIVCKLDPAIGTSVQSGKNVTVTCKYKSFIIWLSPLHFPSFKDLAIK